jgi:hypothetical protein
LRLKKDKDAIGGGGVSHMPISSIINLKDKNIEARGRHMPIHPNLFEGMGM